MSMSSSTYKPSPLSFGSPRSSPFRRPESPASPSTVRSTTPTPSPKKSQTPIQSPSKSNTGPPAAEDTWTPRGLTPVTAREAPTSPTRKGNVASTTSKTGGDGGNALSRLHPNQVRELREGFQLLDRDSDGQVTRDDVADALKNLGQDASPSFVSTFFPPGAPQSLSLPNFLTQLSMLLAPISPPEEMLAAFGAFDEDDNGQIDVVELRNALVHTAPEMGQSGRPLSPSEVDRVLQGFVGKKTFGKKGGPRGDVFRYNEFVGAVSGGGPRAKETEAKV